MSRRRINIGKLNKRVTFCKLLDQKDELGQSRKVLGDIATVWASLYPVRGAEIYEAQKIEGKVTHKCYVRYRPDIDNNLFIKYKNSVYAVESAVDLDGENKVLEIMCVEYSNREEEPHGYED